MIHNLGVTDELLVPLRVPLDLDYTNGSRKLAHVVFKTEM
jgi:hypothetical protein